MHSETFSNRVDATRRERYYKSGRGRDELKSIAHGRTVAAATGRGFESRRPDVNHVTLVRMLLLKYLNKQISIDV